jgi:eukaryotic-like serine/threonine-protein kinase
VSDTPTGPVQPSGSPDSSRDDSQRFADDARRYRLDSRIATGGMGEVWRGTDTALDRPVAIKLLKHEYADDATFRSRFETEARHAAALQHPGIAAVFDVGESQASGVADGSGVPRPFLVMELVDGQPLSALLRPGQSLDPTAVRDLLAQAGDAIGAAHRAGIVHRDIKPANLLVTPDRKIKITDFGIARASEGLGLTGTGQVMGTPQYLSPEQARGEVATTASDVYSLGVVAFECLAGRRPFEAESPVATALAHIQQPVPDLPPSVPADLAAVVHRALAKDPKARFADGTAFAAALRDPERAATAATQVVAPPVPVPAPVPTPAPTPTPVDLVDEGPPDDEDRRSAWPLVVLLLALVAAAVVIVLLLTNDDDPDGTGDEVLPSQSESSPTPSESPSPTETPTESEAPETIELDPGDYVGRDVDEVLDDLRQLGRGPDAQQVDKPGDEETDTVESVSPTRGLVEGDTVTVTYYSAPEPTDEPEPTQEPEPTVPTEPSLPTETASDTAGAAASSDPTENPIQETTP